MSNVLVLEPNADVHALFVRLLRRLGHKAVVDSDAEEVNVVLLEPGSADARRTLAAVRARNPDVYVVCASVYPKEESSVEADAFLVKPVSLAALRSAFPSGGALSD
jgi:CheY-like chemotaxis protein